MKIIYVLIPLSLMLLGLAIWAFFWAVRNDQFEDLDTPAMDILDDEETEVDGGSRVRSQESGVRSQESRSESGVRSQKSEVRSQKSENRKNRKP